MLGHPAASTAPGGAVDSLEPAVQAVLDRLRPRVQAHNGDVSVKHITDDGDVYLQFHAACVGCPFQPTTFGAALYAPLRGVEGVREVYLDGARVSRKALERVMRYAGVEIPGAPDLGDPA